MPRDPDSDYSKKLRIVLSAGSGGIEIAMKENRGGLILIMGGTASGKSEFAERLAYRLSREGRTKNGRPLVYLATLADTGGESRRKIAAHRKRRQQVPHLLQECTSLPALHAASRKLSQLDSPVILLDCLSSLTADILFSTASGREAGQDAFGRDPEADAAQIASAILELRVEDRDLIVVSDLVSGDGVYWEGEMLHYIRVMGAVLSRLAAEAEQVAEVVCGIPVTLKGRQV